MKMKKKSEKEYREETNKDLQNESRETQFARLAARVRKRRIWTAVILMAAVCLLTVSLFNYKAAGVRIKPPIVIGTSGQGSSNLVTGTSSVTISYSLGFKQVSYESEYGSNYSQRLWLWEKVEKKPDTLTAEQYRQLMEQMKQRYQKEAVYAGYFDTFQTFQAAILKVEQNDNQYRIYMAGGMYHFLEYGGRIYSNIDGEPEQEGLKTWNWQPFIITALWQDDTMKLQNVEAYKRGDAGSSKIFEHFPKPLAMGIVGGAEETDRQQELALARAKLAAASHYGKPFAEDTCLQFDPETEIVSIYKITAEPQEPGKTFAENAPLLKRETLKKSGEQE